MNLEKPTYQTVQYAALPSVFKSTSVFNATHYMGETGKNKKEAEQLAAVRITCITYFAETGAGTVMMFEIIKSKYKLYTALNPSLLCSTSGKKPRNKKKAKKNMQVNPQSAGQDNCFKCAPPGHWDSDCQLEGGVHSTCAVSPLPRSRYGGGSARGDRYGSDHRYTDDQYDRGHYADRERYDSRDDRYSSHNRFANDRHPPGGDRFADNKYGVSDRYAQNGSGKERVFY